MSYNVENYRKIREKFEKKRQDAISDAEQRRLNFRSMSREASEIDRALAETGLRIFKAGCDGEENLRQKIEDIRAEHDAIMGAKRMLLKKMGLDEDYTDVRYECKKCLDTGFIDTKMCECMKKALIYEGFYSSGLGALIEKQSFDNFSFKYYEGADLEKMKYNFHAAREYAEGFSDKTTENLLLLGGTGLGKTHISTSIAKTVIENGYDVLYDSAQNIITAFEHDRFRRGYGDNTPDESEKYFNCELLIIDDLGTEVSNSFSVACLYNIINTRINKGMPIVINTNMNQKIMLSRYDERISSRLLGEFTILLFSGEDVRKLKVEN